MSLGGYMKKIIALLLLFLSFTSTVLAADSGKLSEQEIAYLTEVDNAFKESKLSIMRWNYMGSFNNGKDIERMLFYDTETIATPYSDEMDVWWCWYYTGKGQCSNPLCEKNKTNTTKHYHLDRWKYDLNSLKITLLASVVQNEQQEVTDSFDYPFGQQVTTVIKPGSVAESIMIRAKNDIEERSHKKKK